MEMIELRLLIATVGVVMFFFLADYFINLSSEKIAKKILGRE